MRCLPGFFGMCLNHGTCFYMLNDISSTNLFENIIIIAEYVFLILECCSHSGLRVSGKV